MQKYLKIGISYLRGQYLPHLLLTLLFCLASVGFMSFQNLAVEQSAKVLEMYVSLAGIFLLTPLFMPEQNQDIWQLEKSKATPTTQASSSPKGEKPDRARSPHPISSIGHDRPD